ncbi:MAG: enolase C-terminal domain-like protein [Pirellulaceae bacterium]|nr:enolase C-terminal domain-like protein [Pirellulaceae bacterium]MDP7016987.1 enolase C-terminal domain-like protein [Pirellulaceae bacterium]
MIEFEACHVRIPFRFRYGHAAKTHAGLEAVICIARDEAGREGLGEAVPRTYVTGETCASVLADIPRLLEHTTAVADDSEHRSEQLSRQRGELAQSWSGSFPSCACCAIDTALLDLFAQRQGKACAVELGAETVEPLRYSASIGMGNKAKLIATLLAYRAIGFKHFKVKVGDAEDIQRIRLIRRMLGSDATLFADANACWNREDAVRHIEALQRQDVWAVEEPLRAAEADANSFGGCDRFSVLTDDHYRNYRWLRERSPLPLIADESLICLRTAEKIVDHQAFDILNIRLSKCGGPWVSGRIVEVARQNQLRFAFGAMVGETPILATAGAHFAMAHPDHLYVQGFSHRLLHGRRFVSGEPSLRRGGILQPGAGRNGLELRVDENRLASLTIRRETFEL